jgi:hypothetical protein
LKELQRSSLIGHTQFVDREGKDRADDREDPTLKLLNIHHAKPHFAFKLFWLVFCQFWHRMTASQLTVPPARLSRSIG